jgi:hypothetical protein
MVAIQNGWKLGDVLLPLLFIFALDYAIRRVYVNQDDLKFNDTHHPLVFADDVNMLGGCVHTYYKKTQKP